MATMPSAVKIPAFLEPMPTKVLRVLSHFGDAINYCDFYDSTPMSFYKRIESEDLELVLRNFDSVTAEIGKLSLLDEANREEWECLRATADINASLCAQHANNFKQLIAIYPGGLNIHVSAAILDLLDSQVEILKTLMCLAGEEVRAQELESYIYEEDAAPEA